MALAADWTRASAEAASAAADSAREAADITPDSLFHFQLVMFAVPILFLIVSCFIYRVKVTLTEEEHAKIVAKLEETWEDINK